jgi:diphosphomevalonate decarboxylase
MEQGLEFDCLTVALHDKLRAQGVKAKMTRSATAVANANIAFIKYWGNRDSCLRLPANGSISMNLDGLETRTTVTCDPSLAADTLTLNGRPLTGAGLERVRAFMDEARRLAGRTDKVFIASENNFPTGAGMASSAAAFAALALAATRALGLELSERDLSRLARRGSGSACRSVPGGFVEWLPGFSDADSYAVSIAPPEHWALADCVALVSAGHKAVGSSEGHALVGSSPLQTARVTDTPRRLELCRRAILSRDFAALAEIIEQDSNLMHAVMMTSRPALFYWQPGSLAVMQAVIAWRKAGIPAAYTLDAGPNVHVICPAEAAPRIRERLLALEGVSRVLLAYPGGAARILTENGQA